MPSDSFRGVTKADVPHYQVGPDAAGRWLALETHGRGGGVFITRDAALLFARAETERRPGAVDMVDRLVAFVA